jgi:hypothetical protein
MVNSPGGRVLPVWVFVGDYYSWQWVEKRQPVSDVERWSQRRT